MNPHTEEKATELQIRYFLRLLQEKDSETGMRKLYFLCYDRFFRIAYYYLQSEEWAREVVLDVFIKIWERRNTLDKIACLEDYFFITVKNTSLNYLEKERRHKENTEDIQQTMPEAADSPEDILISEELFSRYLKAIDLLPERCREVFIRIREEKKSYAETARELGISIHTVDAQIQKAIHLLRHTLSSEDTK